jgi:hypothetical protein
VTSMMASATTVKRMTVFKGASFDDEGGRYRGSPAG